MRRIPRVAILAVLSLALLLGAQMAGPAQVRAGDDGLAIASAARYEVLPDEGRVQVTVDAVATSLTPDTSTERFFYTGITLAVQVGASNATASSEGRPLAAGVVEADAKGTAIEIRFDREVSYQQAYPFRLSFDLVNNSAGGGAEVRIGRTVVAFPVWAFGSAGSLGSSVEVVLPAEYSLHLAAGDLAREVLADGTQLLTASLIADPAAFFAYVTADRPGAYVETPLFVSVLDERVDLVVRAWEEDPAFGEWIAALMRDGLPALGELIGLPLGIDETLTVEQAAGSVLGDYAGFYLDETQVIQIHYEADPFVALHEAAHAWFNDRLFRARWIGEAFASYYAELAAARLGIEIDDHGLADDLLSGRIALNEWGELGTEEVVVENYAYAATLELARLIGERAGPEGLQSVWLAAEHGEAAYQPVVRQGREPERWAAVTYHDWQRLLDLLEERTGKSYADLWEAWVVSAAELPLLEERAAVRSAYSSTVADAADWELPPIVRHQLGSWSFERVAELLAMADRVLLQRSAIEDRAWALGLVPSPELKVAFESGPSLDSALERAESEMAALDRLSHAEERLAPSLTFLEEIGAIGHEPSVALGAARTAYVAGDLTTAVAQAEAAIARREAAERLGRDRVALAGGGAVGLSGLALVGVGAAIQRGRERPLPAG